MADKTIPDLTAAATLDGTEMVELSQSGSSVRTTTGAIRNAGVMVYRALLSQTGTNAPVATVLENTIGSIAWTRFDVGNYNATLTGAFANGKTAVIVNGFYTPGPDTALNFYSANRQNNNVILLTSVQANVDGAWGGVAYSDDIIDQLFIQILVYP